MEGFDFCCIAWKRRTGWTPLVSSVVVGSSFAPWQPRTVAIQGQQLLYFENGREDGTPRGAMDLVRDQIQIQVVPPPPPGDEKIVRVHSSCPEQGPTPHQMHIRAIPHAPHTHQKKKKNPAPPTPASSSSSTSTSTSTITWKFCFDQQSDLVTCLSHIHHVLEQAGQFTTKATDRFEHDFQTADHIYRWEMIVVPPVIYPIQIHGIVLEAGRNCVVVADFGLTGYSKQQGNEFHHVSGDDSHSTTQAVLAAFKKLRPTQQDQRLHILTLIDPKEIRKWTKAGYDQDSFLQKTKQHSKALEAVSNWFGKLRTNRSHPDNDDSSNNSHTESYHGDQPVVRITSSTEQESSSSPKQQLMKTKQANEVLPQSDPPEIVLERAHYLLEHMNVLPPYHVFYSNSECIAVWCKTGRWSTLQTAVFLGTNSVGAAKSSTLATLGVAAANPLLAPVVALGGLVWITAPMYILKKSREQWQLITEYMTDVFWSEASSKVFVAAIQHWSGLVQKDGDGNIVAVEDALVLRRRQRKQTQRDDGATVGHEIILMEDVHGPLAPPPMMAPPPPPLPLEEEEENDHSDESDLNVEQLIADIDETTTASGEAADLSPIIELDRGAACTSNNNSEEQGKTNAVLMGDTNGVSEQKSSDTISPIADSDDEPVEPPVDIQETASTEYKSKES